jgi:hypothetical protein
MSDGSVKCFGDNTYGQLGTSLASSSFTPITVAGLDLSVPKPPPPTVTKLAAKISKPTIKSKLKGKHLQITSTVKVSAAGLSAATCSGKLAVAVKSGKKKVTSKKFSLKFAKSRCTANMKLSIAKKYSGKKLKFSFSLSGSSTLTSKTLALTKKV